MTVEPIYTDAAERTYGLLAAFRRAADRAQGTWPLKRFASSMLDQFGHVWRTFERIDAPWPDEGGDTRTLTLYENLVTNPSYEDASPLPPTAGTNATGVRAAPGSWTADHADFAWQFTATANGNFGGVISPARIVASPGPLQVSMDALAVEGRTVRISAQPYDGTGTAIGAPVTADVPYTGIGYQRLEASLLMPANTAGVDLSALTLAGVAGERLLIDCVLATETTTPVDYVRYAGVLTGTTSDLVNPDTADDEWLDWLGQLVGVRLAPTLDHAARVDAVKYASAGWQAGTKTAVANAAKTALTGSKYAAVYDHSTDQVNGLGTAGIWDVLVVTRVSETASTAAVLAAIVAKGAKPAGVTLHIRAYQATWAQIESEYPTWAAISAAGSWANIEEAGLV